jgi:purine-binding chemotaxis protein CheW
METKGSNCDMDGALLTISYDVLVFQLDGKTCALKTIDIQEIIHLEPITPVPRAPSYVAGMINFRGSLLTILDPAERLFKDYKLSDRNQGYILIPVVENWPIGLVVSHVEGIVSSENLESMDAPNATQSLVNVNERYCEGIVKWSTDETENSAILLDLETLVKPVVGN